MVVVDSLSGVRLEIHVDENKKVAGSGLENAGIGLSFMILVISLSVVEDESHVAEDKFAQDFECFVVEDFGFVLSVTDVVTLPADTKLEIYGVEDEEVIDFDVEGAGIKWSVIIVIDPSSGLENKIQVSDSGVEVTEFGLAVVSMAVILSSKEELAGRSLMVKLRRESDN